METFSDFKSISTLIFACGFYRPIYEKKIYHVQFSSTNASISSSIEVNRLCSWQYLQCFYTLKSNFYVCYFSWSLHKFYEEILSFPLFYRWGNWDRVWVTYKVHIANKHGLRLKLRDETHWLNQLICNYICVIYRQVYNLHVSCYFLGGKIGNFQTLSQ